MPTENLREFINSESQYNDTSLWEVNPNCEISCVVYIVFVLHYQSQLYIVIL